MYKVKNAVRLEAVMNYPARITAFYEVHYVLSGLKHVVVVEKANMSELDAWICAILFAGGQHIDNTAGKITNLTVARSVAQLVAITSVRWNKLSSFDRRRPSIFVFGDVRAHGILIKPSVKKDWLWPRALTHTSSC